MTQRLDPIKIQQEVQLRHGITITIPIRQVERLVYNNITQQGLITVHEMFRPIILQHDLQLRRQREVRHQQEAILLLAQLDLRVVEVHQVVAVVVPLVAEEDKIYIYKHSLCFTIFVA